MAPTPSDPTLSEVRAGVLRRPGLVCSALRGALTESFDGWLRERMPADAAGVALVAVGGLGRREPAPYADLDLVLLHDGARRDITAVADAVWYPIWDSGVALDHSVRTPDQAMAVARDDLKALLGLLDVRFVAGDAQLAAGLRERVVELWRRDAPKRLAELREISRARWDASGEAAFLLEPNLKDSRGGLRDVRSLYAFALAQLADLPAAVRQANCDLLDVRGELQRLVGRADDVLRLQEHDGVAEALGWQAEDGTPDRDRVLRQCNQAARTISYALDIAWRRLDGASVKRPLRDRLLGRRTAGPLREGIARDVVAQDGEVVLARDANPRTDPGLVVRAARAAAERGLPFATFTLARLAAEAAPVPEPWPDEIRDDFVALLGTGAAAVSVLEALDLAGLLERLIPEWPAVRSLAQHNPVHRYTVDRHLLETAAEAAAHTRDVARPDLLLVGALLHDIGKGFPGDHSVVGADLAPGIATRMGFVPDDTATITALVRHHLLLPHTATRRDLDDKRTIRLVADIAGSPDTLGLLHALAIADAHATGPAAWSDWKGRLIAELARRAGMLLRGAELPPVAPIDDERRRLAEAGTLAVVIRGEEVLVAAPDSVGVLYRTAGVLALHSMDVRSASIRTYEGMAVNSFVVAQRFGRAPDPALVRADLARAMEGRLGLADKLLDKERTYEPGGHDGRHGPLKVLWFDDEATDATVLEIRTADSIGLLFRVTAALERTGFDVRSARVSSFGGAVVDAFYLTTRQGAPVPAAARDGIEQELRAV